MTMQELKIFEEKQIRTVWDEVQEKWYFCIIDIVQILAESKDYLTARKYWNKLKQRLVSEGNETVTNCHQLKLRAADGKLRYSDVADLEQMLRLVQSIPSKKAEPIKRWLAEVGTERIHQMQDPELGIQQSLMDYKRLGYSDNWINQRPFADTKEAFEEQTGKKVVSSLSMKQYLESQQPKLDLEDE